MIIRSPQGLFDLFEVDVFAHGIGSAGRIGFFWLPVVPAMVAGILRSALALLKRSGLILHIVAHISKLFLECLGRFKDRQKEIEQEFVEKVKYNPEEKYFR